MRTSVYFIHNFIIWEFGKTLSVCFISDPHGISWGTWSWRSHFQDDIFTNIPGTRVFLGLFLCMACVLHTLSPVFSLLEHESLSVIALLTQWLVSKRAFQEIGYGSHQSMSYETWAQNIGIASLLSYSLGQSSNIVLPGSRGKDQDSACQWEKCLRIMTTFNS